MDLDPLQDTVPPRYQYESDDEDEWDPTTSASSDNKPPPSTDVKIVPELEKRRPLVLVSGRVGQYWGSGADLGEQKGGVYVNNVQVGLIFEPIWTHSFVIVSEAGTTLPIWSMHNYAISILEILKPTKLSLMDLYPSPSYITSDPILPHQAPVRYLTTIPGWKPKQPQIHPFSSPNLLQATSAAFLALASLPTFSLSSTLVLVPSQHIPPPPPAILKPTDYNMLVGAGSAVDWQEEDVRAAMTVLFDTVGEEGSKVNWKAPENKGGEISKMKRGDVGDGGMYI